MTRPARLPTARQRELAAAIAPAPNSAEERRALRLKATIEEYWRERGYDVDVEPVQVSWRDLQPQRAVVFTLRSNTLNGQPIGGAT